MIMLYLNIMLKFLKRPIVIVPAVIVISIIGGVVYLGRNKAPKVEFMVAGKRDLVQEASVTGRVTPAEDVELAFEVSGKVSRIYARVGDKVNPGATIVALENAGILAELLQAEANLESEQARFAELQKGSRPEEISQAEITLNNVKLKAEVDIKEDYDAALTAAQKAVNVGKTALLTLTDIQSAHFFTNDQEGFKIADAKAAAIKSLLGAVDAGRWPSDSISVLEGGAFGTVRSAVLNPSFENIDSALSATVSAMQLVKIALETVPVQSDFTATEKTDLSSEKTNVSSEITTMSTKDQAIAVQKVTNANAISAAQASLDLIKAGTVPEQISAEAAKVKAAEANKKNVQAQVLKTFLMAPIRGVVTKQDAVVGEIVSANSPVVSLISLAKFEIEANVPEADIAKIKIGNTAKVTLDAYGNEVIFEAKVTKIDPAETIIDGVATYKTTLQFATEDERIKSGMTANVDVLGETREGVIAVPARAVFTKGGEKFVRLLADDGSTREVKVTTGFRGSDGNIEITEGVAEGDKVVTFLGK